MKKTAFKVVPDTNIFVAAGKSRHMEMDEKKELYFARGILDL